MGGRLIVIDADTYASGHPYAFFDQSNVGEVTFEYRGRTVRIPYLGPYTDDIQFQIDVRFEEWKAEVDFLVSCDQA